MFGICYYVTGLGETLHKAGEHVLMYMLIKIKIYVYKKKSFLKHP